MADGMGAGAGNGAVLLGEQATAMLEQTAIQLGINCTACGLEMSGPGFEFVSLRPTMRQGKPTVVVGKVFVCSREDCAVAREEARSKCTAVRPAGGWEIQAAVTGEVDDPDAN